MLPPLSALAARAGTTAAVGTILDDDQLPDELLKKIETMVLDERRGYLDSTPSQCIRLYWTLVYEEEPREFQLKVVVRPFATTTLTQRDFDFMKASFKSAVFGAFSGRRPLPFQRTRMMGRWWEDWLSSLRMHLGNGSFLVEATLTAKDGQRKKVGVTRDEVWALVEAITASFAGATGRAITPDPYASEPNERVMQLCPIRPGEPGFLGRVVSKSLARE